MTPETVAAIDRTAAADDQQGPAVVFVNDSSRGIGRAGFAHRVATETGGFCQFLGARQHLQQQGVTGVPDPHPADKGQRHLQGKIPACRRGITDLFGLQLQQRQQLFRRADDSAQLALPVFLLPDRQGIGLQRWHLGARLVADWSAIVATKGAPLAVRYSRV